MFVLRLCLFVCVNLYFYAKCSSVPVELLCANPTCKEPISQAQGIVLYNSGKRGVLSFKIGQKITITSKSKKKDDYWGAVIDQKSGWVPRDLVKELKVYKKFDDLIPVSAVSLLEGNESRGMPQHGTISSENRVSKNNLDSIPLSESDKANSNPSEKSASTTSLLVSDLEKNVESLPSKTFSVIEGTTIYRDGGDEITPSPTVDVKSSPQTDSPVESVPKDEDNRATISPDVINLNANYKDLIFMKEKNVTLEDDENTKIKGKKLNDESFDEDEYDDEEGDDEEDENDESEDEKLKIDETSKAEKVVTMSSQSYSSNSTLPSVLEKKIEESKTESKIEDSVTSKISSTIGTEIPEQMGKSIHSTNQEEHVDTTTQIMPDLKSQVSNNNWRIMNSFGESLPPKYGERPAVQPILSEPISNEEKIETTLSPQPKTGSMPNQFTMPAPKLPGNFEQHEQAQKNLEMVSKGSTPQPEAENMPNLYTNSPESIVKQHESIQRPVEVVTQASTPQLESKDAPNQNMKTTDIVKPSEEIRQKMEFVTDAPEKMLNVDMEYTQSSFNQPEKVQQNLEVMSEPATTPQTLTPEGTLNQFSETPKPDVKNRNIRTEIPEAVQEKIEVTTKIPEAVQEKIEVTTEIPEAVQEKVEVTTEIPGAVQEKVEVTTEIPDMANIASPEMTVSKAEEQEGSEKIVSLEEPGILSQVTGIFSGWFTSAPREQTEKKLTFEEMFPEIKNNEKAEEVEFDTVADTSDIPPGICHSSDVECNMAETQPSFWNSWMSTSPGINSVVTSNNTFLYLVVTAATVLLFTLGHNFIEKKGKTGPLIAKINKLEQELLVSSKECSLLKDEMQSAKEKIGLYENSSNDELVLSLQAQLEESKRARAELESSIEVLQQELDAATEAGLDLNKMLSEVLTQKGGSETLLESVENLQAQLDSQQKVIDEMTKKLGVKNKENDALQTALEGANEKVDNLEKQLSDIKHNLNLHLKEKEELTKDLNAQINQLKTRINQLNEGKEKEASKVKKELEESQKKLSEALRGLTVKEEEYKALKESVKHLKSKGDVKLEMVFDVCRIKGELAKEEKENKALMEKLQAEESSKKALVEQVKSLEDEVQKLKKGFVEAEQKKEEAEKKLEVLSTYFKEKETQLQKELGLQEALWAQKKGDEKAVYNMMKSLQEEVDSYKSQNETLKKEILDQERGLKNQIAILEQKAHENWVAARQAERKLEENKQETAQLRNRLTLIEKNSNNVDGKGNLRSSEELNGVDAASPVLHETSSPLLFPPLPLDPNNSTLLPPGFVPPPMFMPPPMGGFMPPPPLFPGDRRPPPLGRMSSPPLNNRFSPSSPADYPFERMSSPPLSPPAGNYRSPNDTDREHFRHRTPPYLPLHPRNWDDSNEIPGFIPISSQRDSRRDHKGSTVSSAHSSSDSLDKSSRHSGRV